MLMQVVDEILDPTMMSEQVLQIRVTTQCRDPTTEPPHVNERSCGLQYQPHGIEHGLFFGRHAKCFTIIDAH